MDHLASQLGSIECSVPLVAKKDQLKTIKTLEDFYSYPEQNGWKLRNFVLGESNTVFHEEGASMNRLRYFRKNKSDLLQSWLFFGLISLVVSTSEGSLLPKESMIEGQYINTEKLPKALEQWQEWSTRNQLKARLCLTRSALALDFARKVVRRNLASEVDDIEDSSSHIPHHPGVFVSAEVVLSIMVMGETLSAAMNEIAASSGFIMSGRQQDHEDGWGPPPYVFEKMRQANWCPRSIHLLRAQLGPHATLLLAAFESHKSVEQSIQHKRLKCTKKDCFVFSNDEDILDPGAAYRKDDGKAGVYAPKHATNCSAEGHCVMVGPHMSRVYEILRDDESTGSIPIMEIHERGGGTLELVTRRWKPGDPPFATISHVWSDGLGNEKKNKIYRCQLAFIRSLLQKVVIPGPEGRAIPFWMDTLIIPVRDAELSHGTPPDFNKLKKKAIRQIYHVYDSSSDSIIIDKGLLSIESNGLPWNNLTKLLASGWMRRLWTLQEAYLSKRLWITFKQGEQDHRGIQDLDDLLYSLPEQNKITESFVEMARLKLVQNIMGKERKERHQKQYSSETKRDKALLVANTWRAARWRTTSNPAHETLALATLLNLDYRSTEIEARGLVGSHGLAPLDQLDHMMKDFWQTINKRLEGSIPPGMIFLPGDKVALQGFRWAPRTWMDAHEVDHPDPLSSFDYPTSLDTEGLHVQYPGFILHCPNKKLLLRTDFTKNGFKFPVDRGLLEWYCVEFIDELDPREEEGNKNNKHGQARSSHRPYIYPIIEQPPEASSDLAIILSRSRPQEAPPEIGLLVEIYNKPERRQNNGRHEFVYCCKIMRRVKVSRVKPLYSHPWNDIPKNEPVRAQRRVPGFDIQTKSLLSSSSDNDDNICIGEVVSEDQRWAVDGYEPEETSVPEEPEIKIGKLRRAATPSRLSMARILWGSS